MEDVRLLNFRLEMPLWKMEEALAAPALIAALTSSLNSCKGSLQLLPKSKHDGESPQLNCHDMQ